MHTGLRGHCTRTQPPKCRVPKKQREWALGGEGPRLREITLTCLNTAVSGTGPVGPNGSLGTPLVMKKGPSWRCPRVLPATRSHLHAPDASLPVAPFVHRCPAGDPSRPAGRALLNLPRPRTPRQGDPQRTSLEAQRQRRPSARRLAAGRLRSDSPGRAARACPGAPGPSCHIPTWHL